MTRRLFVTGVAMVVAACGTKKREAKFDYGEPKQRYQLRGKIVRLEPENRVAVIEHEKIEGWMEAMTMGFPVPDEQEYAKLKESAKIRATVLVNESNFWLQAIEVE